MAKVPSPLHTKRVPRRISKPTQTAEAAATIAEAAVAPARKRAAKAAPAKVAKLAKPAKPAAVASAKPAAAPAPAAKAAKAHKPKLVRDSFTMPKDEYQVIDALKQRALGLGRHVRKSELLRAGIQALAALDDKALLKAVGDVPTLKTGRPRKG